MIEIVLEKTAYGWSPEDLNFQHPHLTLCQIYSALAYYWDHQDELDRNEEEGSDIVTDLILDQNNGVWISELGRLEKTTCGFLFTQPSVICRAKKYRIIFDSEFTLS